MKQNFFSAALAVAISAASLPMTAQTTISHQWMTRVDGTSHYVDMVSDMCTDTYGNSFLTGHSHDSTAVGTLTQLVMTTRISTDGAVRWKDKRFAQTDYTVFGKKIIKTIDGNVLCAFNERRDDAMANRIILRKLRHADGALMWEKVLTDTVDNVIEEISDLITDTAGNIYVAASTTNFSMPSFNTDYLVVKLNGNGDTTWRRTYNNAEYNSDDYAVDLALDRNMNVLVTGRSRGIIGGVPTGFDITTLKYSASGTLQWVHRHNGTGYGNDLGMMIITDDANNAYISGQTDAISLSTDSVTVIKLSPTGDRVWQFNYLGSNTGTLFKQPLQLTPSGNIALACGTVDGITTILLNNGGSMLWKRSFIRDNQIAMPFHLAVDDTGNIIVTGRSRLSAPTLDDVTTLRYNEAGVLQWQALYNGSSSGSMDFGRHIGIDGGNNIYIASWTTFDDNNDDYTLLKYGNNPVPADTVTLGVTAASLQPMSVTLYPNPVTDLMSIHFSGIAPRKLHIADIAGRIVYMATLPGGTGVVSANISELLPGHYILVAADDSGHTVRARLIKE